MKVLIIANCGYKIGICHFTILMIKPIDCSRESESELAAVMSMSNRYRFNIYDGYMVETNENIVWQLKERLCAEFQFE